MLNKYEYVIKTCDYVEQTLVTRYPFIGGYVSFNDKLSHLRGRIPSSVLNHIHTIRQQRNYIAHNQEYSFNWSQYDRSLAYVHNWLGLPVIYKVPAEITTVQVNQVKTTIVEKKNTLDAKNVLLAAGAGLAGMGIAGLLNNKKKTRF